MNPALISDLIGMFGYFLTQFGPLLRDFVASDKSVATLMEESGLHKAFEGMKPTT